MEKQERLAKLEELFRMPEVTAGFGTQQVGLNWANRVAPLLTFNSRYHETFLYYLQVVSLNVSNYTAAPAFRIMLNQVEMAIEELNHDLASAPSRKRLQSYFGCSKATGSVAIIRTNGGCRATTTFPCQRQLEIPVARAEGNCGIVAMGRRATIRIPGS